MDVYLFCDIPQIGPNSQFVEYHRINIHPFCEANYATLSKKEKVAIYYNRILKCIK